MKKRKTTAKKRKAGKKPASKKAPAKKAAVAPQYIKGIGWAPFRYNPPQ